MKHIAVKGFSFSVPEGWDDVTLGFYETFYKEKPDTTRGLISLAAKICKIDENEFLSRPAELFNEVVSTLSFLFKGSLPDPSPSMQIGGVLYIIPIEDKLSLGEWVDVDNAQRDGENVLSTILAITCRPAGEAYNHENTEERQKMFASQPVSAVLPVLSFFLHCKIGFDQRTKAYLNLFRAYDLLPLSIGLLQSPGGGIKLLRIWRAIQYWVLMQLLRYRLRKFLRICNIDEIKNMPKTHSID